MTAEEYIKEYTKRCSNKLVGGGYHEWLTPENALAAVELAREDIYKKLFCISKSGNPMDYVKGVIELMYELKRSGYDRDRERT